MTGREEWFVRRTNSEDVARLEREAGLSPVMARIMAGRGITDTAAVAWALRRDPIGLQDGFAMADMDKGVSILANAIRRRDKILVVGDYDADGITSTCILLKVLTDLGALCTYKIPNRFSDGYGININIINDAVLNGVKVILTCDNGIAAAEQINAAVSAGISVVVTDHHQVPEFLPPAHAVINPHRKDCKYPFKELCGAGVAYKFAQCLYSEMGVDTYDDDGLLELAAIGTICDVVSMTYENRIIAGYGLGLLKHPRNLGLRALCAANGIEDRPQTAYTVGFVIGPCLNATGRLEDASLAVQLLMETDPEKAAAQAANLTALNRERQRITDENFAMAMQQIGEEGNDRAIILVYSPDISESVAGIVAGRIKEAWGKPAIVLCKSGEEGILKGSARSVEAVNIYEILCACGDIMLKFGGHPMAAGLTIEEGRLPELRSRIEKLCESAGETVTKVMIDVPMRVSAATLDMAQDITRLEPYGKDNDRPVFADKNLKLVGFRPLGTKGKAAEMQLADANGNVIRTVAFGDVSGLSNFIDKCGGVGQTYLDICYNLNVDTYGGKQRLSIVVTNYRQSREAC